MELPPVADPVAAVRLSPGRALREVCAAFLRLGLTSFGEPIARLGYVRAEFVQKRPWLDDAAYADLVVLPLLRAEVAPPGWVSDDMFLAGCGAAQAVPGPLSTFAGYLGAVIYSGPQAWLGGMWCLLAIFLPAWLLIGGALPFWRRMRERVWAQAALRGACAAVVGVLLAALDCPLIIDAVRTPRDAAACVMAFGLLTVRRAPPLAAVLACAAAGPWWLR